MKIDDTRCNNDKQNSYDGGFETQNEVSTNYSISERYDEFGLGEPLDCDVEDECESMTKNKRVERSLEQPDSTIKKDLNKTDSYVSEYKKYNGEIVSVNTKEKAFKTILESDDGVRSEISFSFDDVDEDEKKFIAIHGKILFIFGKQYMNGTAYNFSKIYFRSGGRWNKPQIEAIKRRAKELLMVLKKNEISDD